MSENVIDPNQRWEDHYRERYRERYGELDGKRLFEVVTAQLATDYATFKGLPPKVRRDVTRHKIKCASCSMAFVSVVELAEPALVVVERETIDPTKVDAFDPRRAPSWHSSNRTVTPWWPYRDGPPPVDPARERRTFPMHPICKCRTWPLRWVWVADRIERSNSRVTVIKPTKRDIRGQMG